MKNIVVVGSINIDLVVQVSRAPEAGETIRGYDFKAFPGGKGANQAAAAALLGGSVSMVGCVGGDTYGPELISNMDRLGVDTAHIQTVKGMASGTGVIFVEDAGENRIIVVPGANMGVMPANVDQALPVITSSSHMIQQFEIPMPTVEYAIDLAIKTGVEILLNPAPAQAIPDQLLQKVDYLILNEIETSMLTGKEITNIPSAEIAAESLRNRGAGIVVITLGKQGAVISSRDGFHHVPAFPVTAVDTTAAGDAFIGGFTVALSEGKDLVAAAVFGNAAGALAASKLGAQSSLPSRSEVNDFLLKQS